MINDFTQRFPRDAEAISMTWQAVEGLASWFLRAAA